jgi:hypothetical protein
MDASVTNWLNSGEYKTQIDNLLTEIVRGAELSITEAETASVFEQGLYFLLKTHANVTIKPRKETNVNFIVHSFSNISRGRLDAVINDLIIEYKHHSALTSKRKIDLAIKQVHDYLNALYNNNHIKHDAILTDGIRIIYFSFVGDQVKNTTIKNLDIDDIDTIIKAILNNDTKKFEPINIVNDFSISLRSDSPSKSIAKILFNDLLNNITDKSDMLYSEWKSLMHLSVDDNGRSQDIDKRRRDLSLIFNLPIRDANIEYKALFALQTTYAIIVKLIACKVVDKLNYNVSTNQYHDLLTLDSERLQKFFQNMEDGYSYSSRDIRNFLEGDFFSWYSDTTQWSIVFYNEIKILITLIDRYSAFSLDVAFNPIDIFKDLYMCIIPQSVRHSMGEYFTPEWLADRVISRSIEIIGKNDWKAIDPCCGSGIFLISLIKKIVGSQGLSLRQLSSDDKKELINKILTRVYGIDINPLSVLSARVSYFIAIQKLGAIEDVEIPVYLGDSAIVPNAIFIDGIECYSYTINNLKCESFEIILPKRFVSLNSFGKAMSKLQALVKTDNSDVLYSVFVDELSDEEKSSEVLLSKIRKLAESLVFLHKNKWDGIWIRIATNFMMIARLHSYDMIVGNPPWVKWEHLPAAYARKIQDFCDVRHIFCNDGGVYGGAQLNICALISNITASNWLEEHGVLAFLMPDSLMSQNSYEEYRNFYLKEDMSERLYLQALDRWLKPLRPFRIGKKAVSQDFNTYYYSRKPVDYKEGVPVVNITRKSGVPDDVINLHSTYSLASRFLVTTTSIAKQLSSNSTAFTYTSPDFDFSLIIGNEDIYDFRTGVESTPFEIFKLISYGESNLPNHYRFKNKKLKTARYKVEDTPPNGWNFPTKYIYPMLEGPNVEPFGYDCGNNFHIVPYDVHDTRRPLSLEYLSAHQSNLATYFADHKELIEMQSKKSQLMHCGDDFYALSKIGPYTFAPNLVAVRDNTNFCSTVVNKTLTPWGELKQTICVKHTIIISQDKDGNFITDDEAHYINGVLNSAVVVDYIHSTFKKNGFSLKKAHLFLPKYNPKIKLFRMISHVSRETTKGNINKNEAKSLLARLYIDLCKMLNHQ